MSRRPSAPFEATLSSSSTSETSHVRTQPARPYYAARVPRDVMSAVWIVVIVGIASAFVMGWGPPQPVWTLIHLVTLGVLTTGIVHWSWYFSRALMRRGIPHVHVLRGLYLRNAMVQVAFVIVLSGMWLSRMGVVVAGACVYAVAVTWHIATFAGVTSVAELSKRLAGDSQAGALASPHAKLVRFYVYAGLFFILALLLALGSATQVTGWLAQQSTMWTWLDEGHDAVTVAHFLAAVGGWLGLTIAGTVVTFVPTMMRTRMWSFAPTAALMVLPLWVAGVLIAVTGALLGAHPSVAESLAQASIVTPTFGVAIGVWLIVLAMLVGIALPLARVVSARNLREFPALSAIVGLAWLAGSCVAYAVWATIAPDFASLRAATLAVLPFVAAGGMVPVFVGALTYLIPVASGGGPSAVRLAVQIGNRWAVLRVALRQAAVMVLMIVTVARSDAVFSPSVKVGLWIFVAVVTVWDVGMVAASIAGNYRVRQSAAVALMKGLSGGEE